MASTEWQKKHREHLRLYQLEWRRKNIEKSLEYGRRAYKKARLDPDKQNARRRIYAANYRAKHRAKLLEYSRAYGKAHRDRQREHCRQWRAKNRKEFAAYFRELRKNNPGTATEQARIYRKKYRPRVLAQQALHRAVRDGIIIRPNRCSNCGNGGKTEAHHSDYSKPLEVIWVCRPCHAIYRRVHRNP